MGSHLKDETIVKKIWLCLEFIFLPYHVLVVLLVMALTLITSPALLDINFEVGMSISSLIPKQ
jgi:hypothetical protein